MIIERTAMPPDIHGSVELKCGGLMPVRTRHLAPDAAESITLMLGFLVFSGMWREPFDQLKAHVAKPADTKPVGYSGHEFGLSVDIAIAETLAMMGSKRTYRDLIAMMAPAGWHCHRRDGERGNEAWHFNYLGPDAPRFLTLASVKRPSTWDDPIEAAILERHGHEFIMTASEVQLALSHLKDRHGRGKPFYTGEVDGDLGPLSRRGIAAFQAEWHIPGKGELSVRTMRTLAIVSASIITQSSPLVTIQ